MEGLNICGCFDKEAIQIKGEQPEERIRIAEILSKLGEFGRLHKLILISTTLLNIALAGIVLTFPFLLHDPSFECVKDGLKFNCNQETACRKDVESTMHYTIHSLVVEYEAYCEGRWLKINGQIIIFVCSSIIATLTMFLMDKRGRRPTFIMVAFLGVISTILLVFVKSWWFIVIAITLLEAISYIMFTNFYIYSTEIFNGKWRSYANSFFFTVYSLGRIMVVLINLGFTHYTHNYILMSVLIVLFCPLAYFCIETPFHHNRRGNVFELKKTLNKINEGNNHNNPIKIEENTKYIDKYLELTEKTEEELNDISIIEMEKKDKEKLFDDKLTLKVYSKHLIIIVFTIIPNYVGSTLIDTVPDKLGLDNIFISYSAFTVTAILANFVLLSILHKIPRRKGNIIVVIIMVSLCLILVIFKAFEHTNSEFFKWAKLIITIIAYILIVIQFLLINRYTNEVFPTKLRSISISIVLMCGRMSMFIGNLLDPLSEILDIHPFVFVGILYLMTLPLFFKFEETLNQQTKN